MKEQKYIMHNQIYSPRYILSPSSSCFYATFAMTEFIHIYSITLIILSVLEPLKQFPYVLLTYDINEGWIFAISYNNILLPLQCS